MYIHYLLLYLISVVPVTLLPTTPDQAFEFAVHHGEQLFRKLQSGCEPDAVNPVDIESLRAIGFSIGNDEKSRWPPDFDEQSVFTADQIKRFKWSLKQRYWRTSVDRSYSPAWGDQTKYYNEYSPADGLITSLAAIKSPHEYLHWSDIAFAIWEATSSFVGLNVKNLRFIAAHSIQHDFTLSIINQLVEQKPGEIRMWGPGTPSFFALLGTPTGARAVYLLMQHKRQLGLKTITKATLFGKSQSQWLISGPDVVFEVGNVVHRIDPAASVNDTALHRLARMCTLFKGDDDEENGRQLQVPLLVWWPEHFPIQIYLRINFTLRRLARVTSKSNLSSDRFHSWSGGRRNMSFESFEIPTFAETQAKNLVALRVYTRRLEKFYKTVLNANKMLVGEVASLEAQLDKSMEAPATASSPYPAVFQAEIAQLKSALAEANSTVELLKKSQTEQRQEFLGLNEKWLQYRRDPDQKQEPRRPLPSASSSKDEVPADVRRPYSSSSGKGKMLVPSPSDDKGKIVYPSSSVGKGKMPAYEPSSPSSSSSGDFPRGYNLPHYEKPRFWSTFGTKKEPETKSRQGEQTVPDLPGSSTALTAQLRFSPSSTTQSAEKKDPHVPLPVGLTGR
ncbi:MAG: hypothetical protein Q9182_000847 [Xanthomendoza sp. 2 TL-2023]